MKTENAELRNLVVGAHAALSHPMMDGSCRRKAQAALDAAHKLIPKAIAEEAALVAENERLRELATNDIAKMADLMVENKRLREALEKILRLPTDAAPQDDANAVLAFSARRAIAIAADVLRGSNDD